MSRARVPYLAPGTDVGGFIVQRLLGRGACGAVYLAWRGGTAFALKLQSLADVGGWARREAHILTRLEHRNVVRFQACGLYPDEAPCGFYLAMEYVEGRTLEGWVREENPGARRVAELASDLARGLAALHAVEVLHRDLKEVNVAIREATGEAVLLDLGVGTYPGAPRVTTGVVPPGTSIYRSPEAHAFQHRHEALQDGHYVSTVADDLYALGVVLYWMLTDTYPLAAVDTYTELEVVLTRMPEPPHAVNPRVPESLSALCMRLLAREASGRPVSAHAVLDALEALLAGAGAAWDVPLCEPHGEAPLAVPEGEAPDDARAEEEWVEHGERGRAPPRRGRRPVAPPAPVATVSDAGGREAGGAVGRAEAPASDVVQVAPLPAKPPSASVRWARARPASLAVLLLLVVTCLGGAAWWLRGGGPGGEMAPPATPAEAHRAAVPPAVAPTPAAAAPVATPTAKEELPVKTQATPPAQSQPALPSRKLAHAAVTAAATLCLGCPGGPQVRKPPELPCPPGAEEAMRKVGIVAHESSYGSVSFTKSGAEESRVITVRAGPVRMRLFEMGELRDVDVSGELFIGERVYGFITEAHLKSGTIPVCLELTDRQGTSGAPRKPGEAGPDAARIFTEQGLRAVDRFK